MLNGIQPTRGEPLPFAKTLHRRAFTLENGFVVYAAPGVEGATPAAQYLNHWHEASFGSGFADAPLHIHAADEPWVDRPVTTFDGAGSVGDFRLIPIPGHTPGATAFLWHGYLFTGDSLWIDGDRWLAAVLGDSDRTAYIDSLQRLQTVEYDYLVPWATGADGPWYAARDDAQLAAVIERLRRGEDR